MLRYVGENVTDNSKRLRKGEIDKDEDFISDERRLMKVAVYTWRLGRRLNLVSTTRGADGVLHYIAGYVGWGLGIHDNDMKRIEKWENPEMFQHLISAWRSHLESKISA